MPRTAVLSTPENKTVEEVQPLAADSLFHAECRMMAEGQRMNKRRIMADREEIMVKNKVTCELTKGENDECGLTYEYSVSANAPRKGPQDVSIGNGPRRKDLPRLHFREFCLQSHKLNKQTHMQRDCRFTLFMSLRG